MAGTEKSAKIVVFSDCRLTPRDAVSNCMIDMVARLKAHGWAATLAARANHRGTDLDPTAAGCVEIRDEAELHALLQTHTHLIYHYTIGDELTPIIQTSNGLKRALYFHGVTPPELLKEQAPEVAKLCESGLRLLRSLDQFDFYASNSLYNAALLPPLAASQKSFVLAPYLHLTKQKPDGVVSSTHHQGVPYLMYLGRFFPHKNVEAVIEFFKECKTLAPHLRLVLAGAESTDVLLTAGSYLLALQKQVQDFDLTDCVSFKFNLNDTDCSQMISQAQVLVSFSRHEGFGVPLVEALANGVPVMTHRKAAIPEVMGEAAIYVDDYTSVIEAYSTFLRRRPELIRIGTDRFNNCYRDDIVQRHFDQFINEFTAEC